jgi:hypothetical protein
MRFVLFKDSKASFLRALDENQIAYSSSATEGIQASGWSIHVGDVSAVAAALASVLVAWIRARASRVVTLTLEGNKVVHLQGLSIAEVERLLPKAESGAVIDTKPEALS